MNDGREITAERWAAIEIRFAQAMELSSDAREQFLLTITDEDVRREVISLVACHAPESRFIEQAIGRIADQWAETADAAAASATAPGRRFGPYEVTAVIGQGGMGAVYKARRVDGQFDQEVAIKLVRHGFETPAALDRFRQERQILARLTHPAIARLLDGGTAIDESGAETPYLVMEFVEGESITAYCAVHAMPLTDRVKLFRLVCDAVQYAHQQLIVHRDLKPSNILVTASGQPKLLDFGIAKLLTPDTERLTARTAEGLQLLTPDYASPEHVNGDPVTATADVYSLGALLYELLTGEKAHKFRSLSPVEIGRVVCDTAPIKPSLAVPRETPGAARIRRQLEGDLDTIVLKALQKDPARRYQSVEQLSEDLRRYLAGLPVLARPDSLTYRTAKFIGRHRWALAGTAVVALSLVTGTAVSVWQERRAERRFEQVRGLANSLIYDVHDEVRDLPSSTKARQKIVSTGLEYLNGLARDAGGDLRLQRDLAAAYVRIGDVQGGVLTSNLGDFKGALESYRKARSLFEPDTSPDRARELANVDVKIGDVLSYTGDMTGALSTYAVARSIIEPVAAAKGSSVADREQLARVFLATARVQGQVRDNAKSLESSEKVLAIRRDLLAMEPGSRERIDSLADTEAEVGMGLQRQGHVREALEHAQLSLKYREQLAREQPNNVAARRNLILSYSHVADALGNPLMPSLGDAAGANEIYRKMTAVAEELVAADPSDQRAKWDLANCLLRLGSGLVTSPAHAEGIRRLEDASTMMREISVAEPTNNRVRGTQVFVERRLGDTLTSDGRAAEAIEYYRRAIQEAETTLRADPADAATTINLSGTHGGLGMALAKTGQHDAAVAEGHRGIEIAGDAQRQQGGNNRTAFTAAQAHAALAHIYFAFPAPADRKQGCASLVKSLEIFHQAQQTSPIDDRTAAEFDAIAREAASCK
jgi:eukaryotic-like serine/threonine-protein kinase